MIYGKSEPTNIYEVKALLYVQEAQMDKYHQQLTTPSATTNIVNSMNNKFSAKTGIGNGNFQHQRARGHGFRGRGQARQRENYTQVTPFLAHQDMLQIPYGLESQTWFADSGASHHITFLSSNLQQVHSSVCPNEVLVGNGHSLAVHSTG
ncbi:hypothetical protein KIW84_064871 [Lathyrus oleraceus]|uniref:Uncharacterized protein n=1 Tax=Pisum sativum TaxID=3888 RepID=A0A9D5A9M8_PEA|nr:hypothetical protein KIW84_064871 [Pisum sativum]